MDDSNNSIIKIDNTLSRPLYKQIISSIHDAIASGIIKNGDLLPSVNFITAEYSLARGSVFKAYNELRTSGIIDSIPGKGYFVTSTNVQTRKNIFLLLSTFNPYREVFFNAFINQIGNEATVDIYFHHHNISVFKTLIENHAAYYNTFVIMPEINRKTQDILKKLDPKKLYILDSGLEEFGSRYPCVCQNYEKDISGLLSTHMEQLKKYKRIVLLFPENIKTEGVVKGFTGVFKQTGLHAEVIRDTAKYEPQQYDCCITTDDNDLVKLIRAERKNGWKLGKDIGILSYNDTPLKSIISDGITTITTDFEQMGRSMADMIMKNKREHIENPFLMIDRKSF